MMTRFSTFEAGLVLAYEEEVEGEGYFSRLAHYHDGRKDVLMELALLERQTATALKPLISKYGLAARSETELLSAGAKEADSKKAQSWSSLIDALAESLPAFVSEFETLEAMAPKEDVPILRLATAHEVALLQFARLEQAKDGASLVPIRQFLQSLGETTGIRSQG